MFNYLKKKAAKWTQISDKKEKPKEETPQELTSAGKTSETNRETTWRTTVTTADRSTNKSHENKTKNEQEKENTQKIEEGIQHGPGENNKNSLRSIKNKDVINKLDDLEKTLSRHQQMVTGDRETEKALRASREIAQTISKANNSSEGETSEKSPRNELITEIANDPRFDRKFCGILQGHSDEVNPTCSSVNEVEVKNKFEFGVGPIFNIDNPAAERARDGNSVDFHTKYTRGAKSGDEARTEQKCDIDLFSKKHEKTHSETTKIFGDEKITTNELKAKNDEQAEESKRAAWRRKDLLTELPDNKLSDSARRRSLILNVKEGRKNDEAVRTTKEVVNLLLPKESLDYTKRDDSYFSKLNVQSLFDMMAGGKGKGKNKKGKKKKSNSADVAERSWSFSGYRSDKVKDPQEFEKRSKLGNKELRRCSSLIEDSRETIEEEDINLRDTASVAGDRELYMRGKEEMDEGVYEQIEVSGKMVFSVDDIKGMMQKKMGNEKINNDVDDLIEKSEYEQIFVVADDKYFTEDTNKKKQNNESILHVIDEEGDQLKSEKNAVRACDEVKRFECLTLNEKGVNIYDSVGGAKIDDLSDVFMPDSSCDVTRPLVTEDKQITEDEVGSPQEALHLAGNHLSADLIAIKSDEVSSVEDLELTVDESKQSAPCGAPVGSGIRNSVALGTSMQSAVSGADATGREGNDDKCEIIVNVATADGGEGMNNERQEGKHDVIGTDGAPPDSCAIATCSRDKNIDYCSYVKDCTESPVAGSHDSNEAISDFINNACSKKLATEYNPKYSNRLHEDSSSNFSLGVDGSDESLRFGVVAKIDEVKIPDMLDEGQCCSFIGSVARGSGGQRANKNTEGTKAKSAPTVDVQRIQSEPKDVKVNKKYEDIANNSNLNCSCFENESCDREAINEMKYLIKKPSFLMDKFELREEKISDDVKQSNDGITENRLEEKNDPFILGFSKQNPVYKPSFDTTNRRNADIFMNDKIKENHLMASDDDYDILNDFVNDSIIEKLFVDDAPRSKQVVGCEVEEVGVTLGGWQVARRSQESEEEQREAGERPRQSSADSEHAARATQITKTQIDKRQYNVADAEEQEAEEVTSAARQANDSEQCTSTQNTTPAIGSERSKTKNTNKLETRQNKVSPSDEFEKQDFQKDDVLAIEDIKNGQSNLMERENLVNENIEKFKRQFDVNFEESSNLVFSDALRQSGEVRVATNKASADGLLDAKQKHHQNISNTLVDDQVPRNIGVYLSDGFVKLGGEERSIDAALLEKQGQQLTETIECLLKDLESLDDIDTREGEAYRGREGEKIMGAADSKGGRERRSADVSRTPDVPPRRGRSNSKDHVTTSSSNTSQYQNTEPYRIQHETKNADTLPPQTKHFQSNSATVSDTNSNLGECETNVQVNKEENIVKSEDVVNETDESLIDSGVSDIKVGNMEVLNSARNQDFLTVDSSLFNDGDSTSSLSNRASPSFEEKRLKNILKETADRVEGDRNGSKKRVTFHKIINFDDGDEVDDDSALDSFTSFDDLDEGEAMFELADVDNDETRGMEREDSPTKPTKVELSDELEAGKPKNKIGLSKTYEDTFDKFTNRAVEEIEVENNEHLGAEDSSDVEYVVEEETTSESSGADVKAKKGEAFNENIVELKDDTSEESEESSEDEAFNEIVEVVEERKDIEMLDGSGEESGDEDVEEEEEMEDEEVEEEEAEEDEETDAEVSESEMCECEMKEDVEDFWKDEKEDKWCKADEEEVRRYRKEEQQQDEESAFFDLLRVIDKQVRGLAGQQERLADLQERAQAINRVQSEVGSARKEAELVRQKLRSVEADLAAVRTRNCQLLAQLETKTEEVRLASGRADELAAHAQQLQREMDHAREEQTHCTSAAWRQEFERLRSQGAEREELLLADCEWKLRDVQRRAQERVLRAEQEARQHRDDSEAQLKQVRAEAESLRAQVHDSSRLLRAHAAEVAALTATEQGLTQEVGRLRKTLEHEKGVLGTLREQHRKELDEKEHRMVQRLEEQASRLRQEQRNQDCTKHDSTIKKLNEKLEAMKVSMKKSEAQWEDTLEKVKGRADWELLELRRLMDKQDIRHAEQLERLQETHSNQIELAKEEYSRRVSELESALSAQACSARATLELVKGQLRQEHAEALQKLKEAHRQETEKQWEMFEADKEQCLERMKAECTQEGQEDREEREKQLAEDIQELKSSLADRESDMGSLKSEARKATEAKLEAEKKLSEVQSACAVRELAARAEVARATETAQREAKDTIDHLTKKCACLSNLFEDMRSRWQQAPGEAAQLRRALQDERARTNALRKQLDALSRGAARAGGGEATSRNNKATGCNTKTTTCNNNTANYNNPTSSNTNTTASNKPSNSSNVAGVVTSKNIVKQSCNGVNNKEQCKIIENNEVRSITNENKGAISKIRACKRAGEDLNVLEECSRSNNDELVNTRDAKEGFLRVQSKNGRVVRVGDEVNEGGTKRWKITGHVQKLGDKFQNEKVFFTDTNQKNDEINKKQNVVEGSDEWKLVSGRQGLKRRSKRAASPEVKHVELPAVTVPVRIRQFDPNRKNKNINNGL